MTVQPSDIAVALGIDAPPNSSTQYAQWNMWIDDAVMLIEARRTAQDPAPMLDDLKLDYVVREAVVSHIRHPEDATNVTVSVDDASTSKTYRSGSGRVRITDEWWALLGLAPVATGAFSITPTGGGLSPHMPWCNLMFLGTLCSCGANLTGYRYPLWEGGALDGDWA